MPRDKHFDQKTGEPKRDRWGRYLLPHPETGVEQPWTRVTTVSGILSDRYNLELWAQRMVALGLASRPDLLALVKTHRTNKRTLNKVVKDALEAGNTEQRANIGTAIHAATEAVDRGEPHDLGPPYDRDVEVYGSVMDELGLDVVPGWIERIVLNVELGVAGTLDRLVKASGWKLPRIADVKTGKTVHFSELDHAIQQSMYANASHYWDAEKGELVKVPRIDKKSALIVHLPAGEARCEVHDLDIATGYAAAKLAVEVKSWRGRKGLSQPYEN
jgi:hypothetical protein